CSRRWCFERIPDRRRHGRLRDGARSAPHDQHRISAREQGMAAQSAAISLSTPRWKSLLGALIGAALITLLVLIRSILPMPPLFANPWMYEEPGQTIYFVLGMAVFGYIFLINLYWAVTPLPLLWLNGEKVIYRPFPTSKTTINWADVARVSTWLET